MAESIGMTTWQVPFPSWKTMAPQIALFFVFEDMFHYFGRLFHSPKIRERLPDLARSQPTKLSIPALCTSTSTKSTTSTRRLSV